MLESAVWSWNPPDTDLPEPMHENLVIIAWYEPVSNAFSKNMSSYDLVLMAYAESECSGEAKASKDHHTK